METGPHNICQSLASQWTAETSESGSTQRHGRSPRRLTAPSLTVLGAFAGGFIGGLIGGLAYCLALAYFHPDGLKFAWLRVLVLSLTFGGFEMWRVTRQRSLMSARSCLLWTLLASLFVLWALGTAISITDSLRQERAPRFIQSGLARIA